MLPGAVVAGVIGSVYTPVVGRPNSADFDSKDWAPKEVQCAYGAWPRSRLDSLRTVRNGDLSNKLNVGCCSVLWHLDLKRGFRIVQWWCVFAREYRHGSRLTAERVQPKTVGKCGTECHGKRNKFTVYGELNRPTSSSIRQHTMLHLPPKDTVSSTGNTKHMAAWVGGDPYRVERQLTHG